jgi:signal transduction histidine kinase
MKALRYAATGAVLSLGAPLGLLLLRRLAGMRDRGRANRLTYLYIGVSTTAAFAAFGCALGRRADQLRRGHQELDRLRDELALVIAHDLRSPVTALRLQAQHLLGQAATDEVKVPRGAIERIAHATDGLARMIDDLLDASRVEARRLNLDLSCCQLSALVAEIVERQRPALAVHPIDLRIGSCPPVLVDRNRFAQILTNLLDNAGKYSDAGTPIGVSVEAADGGIAVRVEDRGWGIAADELPQLFDRFYQAKRARAQKSGLGLGLYIVKGLVEAHAGRISVASERGRGSTFSVWFPAAADR